MFSRTDLTCTNKVIEWVFKWPKGKEHGNEVTIKVTLILNVGSHLSAQIEVEIHES